MKIRFNCTIPRAHFTFHMGQVIEVEKPTPEMLAWLEPLPDGTRRAEVVREDDLELATVAVPERAVTRRSKRREV